MFSELLKGTVILLACQTHRLVPESEEQELSHKKKTKKNPVPILFWQLHFITDMPPNGQIRLLFPNIFPGGMPRTPQVRLRAFGARVRAFGPHSDQLAPFCQMGGGRGGVDPFFWVPKCIPDTLGMYQFHNSNHNCRIIWWLTETFNYICAFIHLKMPYKK